MRGPSSSHINSSARGAAEVGESEAMDRGAVSCDLLALSNGRQLTPPRPPPSQRTARGHTEGRSICCPPFRGPKNILASSQINRRGSAS